MSIISEATHSFLEEKYSNKIQLSNKNKTNLVEMAHKDLIKIHMFSFF